MSDIRRGEIFYISGGKTIGSEQRADRPAVVVSNDKNNEHSQTVEVVYLTTRPKAELPTHTIIRSTGRLSTVLCEQIQSISIDRIKSYIGKCTEEEMGNINIALMISLDLDVIKRTKKYMEEIRSQERYIEKLEAERDMMKQLYSDTFRQVIQIQHAGEEK